MKILVVNRNVVVSIFAVMLLIYGVQGISYGQEAPDDIVEFSDANLAREIRKALRLPTGDGVDLLKIPKSELKKLTELRAIGEEITDLTGLEHASQLTVLNLNFNDISDITPLAQLTQLTELNLRHNNISDITPLAQLTQLTELNLERNQIRDLTPLAQLTQLTSLNLAGNNISDITPLTQLTRLTELVLNSNWGNNNISDLTALAQLTQLTELDLRGNNVSNITPLAQLTQLTELDLRRNKIANVTPLAPLTQLIELDLSNNLISDITALAQLTQLTELDLSDDWDQDGNNHISDITPLAQLTQLTELVLYDNRISDVTPLAQLTQLTQLNLKDNLITDVTPLAELISLKRLRLEGNPIWSTYPLNALLDANPGVDLDIQVTDAVPFPMPAAVNEDAELQVLSPELQGQPMFWVNTGTGKIESSGHFDVVTQEVTVLTVDRAGSKLYWGERGKSGGTIKRADFDGTNVEALVSLSNVPRGIAIDAVGNKLYWTNSDLQIQSATLNGENISTVIQLEEDILEKTEENCRSGGVLFLIFLPLILSDFGGSCTTETISINLTSPTDIAVNTVDGRLYWTEFSGRIRRVNLDGTGLGTLLPDIGSPYGITVAGDKVYWAEEIDENSGKIQRANLNGTNIETLAKVQGLPAGISVDTAAGKVYWANSLGGIQRTDINGGAVENVVLGITAPGDFVLVPSAQPTTPTTATTDATVNISPASVASPAVGEQLELNLNITGGEAVAGYQATVQFDTTALRYVSGANRDFLPAGAFFVEPKVEGNLIKLNAVSLTGESNGGGTLATLTFEVIAVKVSTLTLSDVLLTNSAGETFVPRVENAEITESTGLTGDVNGDGQVNIADLVLVAGALGKTGQNAADVNGDGTVNIADLVLVAGALGNSAAAPSLHPQALEMLTATEIKQWLSQAQQLDLTDTTSQRGILFLEQLLIALTPKETALLPNYPNPFNPETWIPYQLAKDADVTLHIYTVNGTLVRTLTLRHQAAGMYQNRSRAAYWDGKNEFGEKVASGLYFYTLTAGDFSATRKMLIRK